MDEELERELEEKKENAEPEKPAEASADENAKAIEKNAHIFALRTTANREEQVMDFITSNAKKKKLGVYSVIHPHGMRGYLFIEAKDSQDAEQAAFRVPYARGLLQKEVSYEEIEHMLEPSKKVEVNIQKGDIVEIIAGPAFKHSQAKVNRVDKTKEEVVVELLESAVPIPITLKLDAVKVIRRESDESEAQQKEE
ncbi:transcription elongation factor Spt5 [Candidatus Woesearchaeota archaeon]|nr:transcription elongation factor Spt5 [Candidatus Woesearchaeota archaeon]